MKQPVYISSHKCKASLHFLLLVINQLCRLLTLESIIIVVLKDIIVSDTRGQCTTSLIQTIECTVVFYICIVCDLHVTKNCIEPFISCIWGSQSRVTFPREEAMKAFIPTGGSNETFGLRGLD
jgi:hypothetical protein